MSQVILLLGLVAIASLVFLVGLIMGFLVVGARMSVICFGFGPLLTSFHAKIGQIELRPFLLGGYLKPVVDELNKRSRLTRIVVNLGGPVAVLVSSAMVLTIPGMIQHFASTFGNLYTLTRFPKTEGSELWAHYFTAQGLNVLSAYGIVAAKFAACNLLPLPTVTGGKVLFEVLGLKTEGKVAEYTTSLLVLAFLYPVFRMFQSLYYWFYS